MFLGNTWKSPNKRKEVHRFCGQFSTSEAIEMVGNCKRTFKSGTSMNVRLCRTDLLFYSNTFILQPNGARVGPVVPTTL